MGWLLRRHVRGAGGVAGSGTHLAEEPRRHRDGPGARARPRCGVGMTDDGEAPVVTVRRVMGTETEYGIAVPGQTSANHMLASSQIVNAYLNATTSGTRDRRPRWDFEEESPLRDARGFDMAGGVQVGAGRDAVDTLADDEIGLANVILTNGARLYVDHAHPEYSTPEVTNPRDAVIWDKAGERVMAAAAEHAARTIPGAAGIQLYKNNTDNKGASYGCHENYLMRRQTPFADIVRHLTPFFVSRQVMVGAGRVGIGQDGRQHGFQISQRADFFEVEVGLETTLKRPIINTRDEPHADPDRYRRLHVIIGDANRSELSSYLKGGPTALALSGIQQRSLRERDGGGRVDDRASVVQRTRGRPRHRLAGRLAARDLARPDAASRREDEGRSE